MRNHVMISQDLERLCKRCERCTVPVRKTVGFPARETPSPAVLRQAQDRPIGHVLFNDEGS